MVQTPSPGVVLLALSFDEEKKKKKKMNNFQNLRSIYIVARANWITKIKHLDSVCGCNCVRSVDKNCLGFVCCSVVARAHNGTPVLRFHNTLHLSPLQKKNQKKKKSFCSLVHVYLHQSVWRTSLSKRVSTNCSLCWQIFNVSFLV